MFGIVDHLKIKPFRSVEKTMDPSLSKLYPDLLENDNHFTCIEGYDDTDNNIVRTKFGDLIAFTNYSYLGLLKHPEITDAVSSANLQFGSGALGARFLSGTTSLHNDLETALSVFLGSEQTLTFSSGYTANMDVMRSLAGPEDVIILDQYSHTSTVEGSRLSGARIVYFKHNDVHDLARILTKTSLELAESDGTRTIYVSVEGLYSMHGDIARLPQISALCRRFEKVVLLVDEAHSMGVLGRTGRGILEHFRLEVTAVDFRTGTFSKAFPSVGGFVAGSQKAIRKLTMDAKSFMYSAGLSPLSAAAALATIRLLSKGSERVSALHERSRYLRRRLTEAGYVLPFADETPTVPIVCGTVDKATEASKYCRQQGLLVSSVFYPVVPQNYNLLRVSVTARHTHAQIDRLVTVLSTAATRFELPGWGPRVGQCSAIAKL